MNDDQDDRIRRAEDAYGDYLAKLESHGDGALGDPRFDALLKEHSELASELRQLHADVQALRGVKGRIAATDGVRSPALAEALDALARDRSFNARYSGAEEIGIGGQGRVFEASDESLGRRVAIKMPRSYPGAHPPRSEPATARLLAEARITAQLDHPGIVAVHEVGLNDSGTPYFTMTRVRGLDAAEVFRRSREGDEEWTRVRCASLLLRVAEATAFAHSRGVIHRDLKPQNVMVGAFGEVYVMDWGLARQTEDPNGANDNPEESRQRPDETSWMDTEPGSHLGTLDYLAPEVARSGSLGAGPLTDVYALGAMLHELLTGTPPHRASLKGRPKGEALKILAQGAARRTGVSAQVDAELAAIADRALANDPGQRYVSMGAMAADLRAYLEGRVVAAHEAGPWAELNKWVQRNRTLAVALLLLAVSVLAGLASVAILQAKARRTLDQNADLYRLPYLEEEAARLWPETPDRLPAMDAWLAKADRLATRLDLHRSDLAELQARASVADPQGPRGALRFDNPKDALRHDALKATVERLEALVAPETGLLAQVRARRTWARSVEDVTVRAHAPEWARAAQAVAPAVRLDARVGLVPLGPDPASGLEEFALLRSGEPPMRDASGRLVANGNTALVFVLVPGGTCMLGTQSEDPSTPGYDRSARSEESPVHTVGLVPFWISKYEMTQGQWLRLGGGTPSFVREEAESGDPNAHPVEGVSWSESVALLARFELTLPTEAQWAFAARAGTAGPFFGFEDPEDLTGYVNLADQTVLDAALGWPQARGMDWLHDGHIRHAPAGSFAPNPWGLHDMIGNVWEWCLDPPSTYSAKTEDRTGLRLAPDEGQAVARGGGFINNATYARIAIRDMGRSQDFDSSYHGVRPVMRIEAAQD